MELREKDTRKVVAGLKCCTNDLADCTCCYLFGEDRCRKVLLSDALEHIKELEREVEYFSEKHNEACIELAKERGAKWISVEDRLPEKKDMVLAFAMDKDHSFAFLSDDENWYNSNGFLELNITHWMPLPEPPKPKEPTFKDVFLEKFPKAATNKLGTPIPCLEDIFTYVETLVCKGTSADCDVCWNQPYFEEEGEGDADNSR